METGERIEQAEINEDTGESIYLTGPAEFLVIKVAEEIAKVPQFLALFGEEIDHYKRMDYGIRNLPALRIYNNEYQKTFDSWFIEGDLVLDVIWPASFRREDTQQIQDTVSAALLQQFRRPKFGNAVETSVPGLNELGKTFSVDKSLGFEFEDEVVPLTQIRANFKIDIRQWDLFLERDNRTKQDPFERTLTDLEKIVASIDGLIDNGDTEVTVEQVEIKTV